MKLATLYENDDGKGKPTVRNGKEVQSLHIYFRVSSRYGKKWKCNNTHPTGNKVK